MQADNSNNNNNNDSSNKRQQQQQQQPSPSIMPSESLSSYISSLYRPKTTTSSITTEYTSRFVIRPQIMTSAHSEETCVMDRNKSPVVPPPTKKKSLSTIAENFFLQNRAFQNPKIALASQPPTQTMDTGMRRVVPIVIRSGGDPFPPLSPGPRHHCVKGKHVRGPGAPWPPPLELPYL